MPSITTVSTADRRDCRCCRLPPTRRKKWSNCWRTYACEAGFAGLMALCQKSFTTELPMSPRSQPGMKMAVLYQGTSFEVPRGRDGSPTLYQDLFGTTKEAAEKVVSVAF